MSIAPQRLVNKGIQPFGGSTFEAVGTCDTVAALKAFPVAGLVAGYCINVNGYATGLDGGGGQFRYDPASVVAQDNGTVIQPNAGGGRWLRNYVGPVNVRWFGAKGDGATDDATAIQAVFSSFNSILIPEDGNFVVNTPITRSGGNVSIYLYGKISDRVAAFAGTTSDILLTNKATIALGNGQFSVIGNGKQGNLDGGKGVGGVSQNTRHGLYFYNCTRVYVSGIRTDNVTGYGLVTVICTDISHVDCIHNNSLVGAGHRSATRLNMVNVFVSNAGPNGIVASNRGVLDVGVCPYTHGTYINILGCKVYSCTVANSDAVGLTIDTCDIFTCTGNIVDMASVGTQGISLADATQGTVTGNLIKNVDNLVAPGGLSYGYCGIGMESVRTVNVIHKANTFIECVCAYQISNTTNCCYDGDYIYTYGMTHNASTGAVVSAFAQVGGPVGGHDINVRISGSANGGSSGIAVNGYVDQLTITDFNAINLYNSYLVVLAGSVVAQIHVKGGSYYAATAQNVIVFNDNTVTRGTVTGLVSTAAAAGGTFAGFGSVAGTFAFEGCTIKNSTTVFAPSPGVTTIAFAARNNNIDGATTVLGGTQGNVTNRCYEGNIVSNVKDTYAGSNADVVLKTAAPAGGDNAKFIGQRWLDTTNQNEYFAFQTGTGPTDWLQVAKPVLANASTANQTPAAAARTYITGSNIAVPATKLKIGTQFFWRFNMTKTAAGVAASTIDVAVGTNGTTADTARLSFAKLAGTAAVDEGWVEVYAVVRGPLSAAGIMQGEMVVLHNGNTVGHMTIPLAVVNAISAGFDVTVASLIVGLCITTGAADAITISEVHAQALNL